MPNLKNYRRLIGWSAVACISVATVCMACVWLVIGPRINPTSFSIAGSSFTARYITENEGLRVDIVDAASGRLLHTLSGSTDLVCDPPTLLLADADGDGITDLYFRECGGHGLLHYRPATHDFIYQSFRQENVAVLLPNGSLLWREVLNGGARLTVIALCAALLAAVFALLWLVARR